MPGEDSLPEAGPYGWLLGREQGLRRRLVRPAIFLAIFLPILFMAVFGYRVVHSHLTEMALERRQAIASVFALSLKERFNSLSEVGVSLASRVAFRKAIEEGRWQDAIAILDKVDDELPYLDRIFLTDAGGTVRADLSPGSLLVGRSYAHRDWYHGVKAAGGAYVSDVYRREAEPRCNVVTIGVPIRSDAGSELGILGLQVRAATLLEWARGTDVGPAGFVYFTDRSGRLAAHPDGEGEAEDGPVDYSSVEPVQAALAGQRGVIVSLNPLVGEDRVTAYEPVPDYGWTVVAQQPASAAFAPRDRTLWSLALIYGGVALLSLALAAFTVMLIGALESREAVVRRLNREVAQRAVAFQEASQAKSRFVANISHELRSPLHAIIGFSELVSQGIRGPLTPEQAEDLGVVVANARHLLTLIDDLIDVAKIESGRIELQPGPLAIGVLVDEVVKAQSLVARDKGLALRAEVEPGLPSITVDHPRMRQALLNVVQNAVKFTSSGGVTLRAARRGDELLLSVTDTGPGIPETELGSLFARFAQSRDLGRLKKDEGMGLGLHLVKQLVELHGGRVWAESPAGQGATIHIGLPLTAGAAP